MSAISPFAELDPGFYWIQITGCLPEVARWDAETQAWVVAGSDESLGIEYSADIIVISPLIQPGSMLNQEFLHTPRCRDCLASSQPT